LLDEFEEEYGIHEALDLWYRARERAAIREIDGGTERRSAESLAIGDVVTRMIREQDLDSDLRTRIQEYLERKFGRARS